MSIGIYKITNKINNKCYIGQSVDVEKRITTHFWAAFRENLPSYNNHLYQAIRKYGEENFDYVILKTLKEPDKVSLDKLEQYYIKKYDSFHNGYNMNEGGNTANQNIASGERNGHAKLTEKDVIEIRKAYNNHELKRDVYKRYEDRINKTGFHKIWNWNTWKNILPEYHNKENIKWHSHQGKGLSSEQASLNASKINKKTICFIRELYEENIPCEEIKEILNINITVKEIEVIARRKKFTSF